MPELGQKEKQQELFAEYAPPASPAERFPSLAKPPRTVLISATTEQLLFAAIVTVLALCLVFFLGVLRGKSLGNQALSVRPNVLSQPIAPVRAPMAPANPLLVRQAGIAGTKTLPVAGAQSRFLPVALAPDVGAAPLKKPFLFFDQKTKGKPYTIQLLTHKKKETAQNEVQAMRKAGIYSFIIPSGEFYQVCAGQYASNSEAKKDLTAFKSRYPDCFLRRQ
jgi:cell division septation protein DedD